MQTTAHKAHTAPLPTVPPLRNFTPCEETALDRMIDGLRTGRIDDVVLRHLEVDGVLSLDPLLHLTGATPCPPPVRRTARTTGRPHYTTASHQDARSVRKQKAA